MLKGRKAVVTGAGRGIGAALSHALAGAGAQVAMVSRTESTVAAVAETVNASHPGMARAFALDVADFEACQQTGKAVIDALDGAVDIVVNNAGITRDGLFLRMKEEDWDAVLNTNLKGAFNMARALQKPLLRSPHGRIINVTSVIGLTGNAGQANYAASKAGLIGLSKTLAREFAGRGVTCNCIAPGFIDTEMTSELPEKALQIVMSRIPMGRFGSVDDICAAVLYLAGDSGRYITGQVITVDGGMTM